MPTDWLNVQVNSWGAATNSDFAGNGYRVAYPTAYAQANGVPVKRYFGDGSRWWLRTSGAKDNMAMCVGATGAVYPFGGIAEKPIAGVRPVVQVDYDQLP